MDEQAAIEKQINHYLDAVREQLAGLSQDEVDSIIDDLREHITARLAAAGDRPTADDVQAVLAAMDPPESFAQGLEGVTGPPARVSRLAIIGAALLPIGIIAGILFLIPVGSASYSVVNGVATAATHKVAWWQWLLRFTVLPLGVISPFATTILGIVSLSQIRASGGRLVGKPLALVDALFYPLLLLDGLLVAALAAIIVTIPGGRLALTESLSLLGLVLVIIIDLVVVTIAWRKVR
jgi:hypothetical protein